MTTNIFTYGSLMFPAVWQRVVRGQYRAEPATLADHARYALVDETYPGVVPQAGASVEGVLYRDVDTADVVALDTFEGIEYARREVVVTLDSGVAVQAGTYIFLLPQRLAGTSWEPAAFRMAQFLGTYCRDKLGE